MFNFRQMNIAQLNERYGLTMENTIFLANDPCGYQINVYAKGIGLRYIKYKQQIKIPSYCLLNNEQRLDFEAKIFAMLEKNRQKTQPIPTDQSEIS